MSLIVMIFSGLGFKVFQFGGSLLLWMAVIFLMNLKPILKLPAKYLFWTLSIILLSIFIFLLKGVNPPFFKYVAILSSLFVLSNYIQGGKIFFYDFSKICKWFMYYSLLSIPLMLMNIGMLDVTFGYSEYKTFGFLFWFSTIGGPEIFNGLRMTGITWEPGIWQMFLNINLLFAFYERRSASQIYLALIATITCFSTTGFIVNAFVLILYFFYIKRTLYVREFIIPVILIFAFLPSILNNFNEKIDGEHMGSGATRVADFFTGAYILSQYPLLGSDVELATASVNEEIVPIKTFFWRGNYTDGAYEGYLTVPNSNGYMRFLIDWGLPLGLTFLWILMFRSNLLTDRRLYISMIIIILVSMSAEAISRTSFFYFLILSSLFIKPLNAKLNRGLL